MPLSDAAEVRRTHDWESVAKRWPPLLMETTERWVNGGAVTVGTPTMGRGVPHGHGWGNVGHTYLLHRERPGLETNTGFIMAQAIICIKTY